MAFYIFITHMKKETVKTVLQKSKTNELNHSIPPITNYLDIYRDTRMYQFLVSDHVDWKVQKKATPESLFKTLEGEDKTFYSLKRLAEILIKHNLVDDWIYLLDIASWMQHLIRKEEKKSIREFIEWKYTNPECSTY